MSEDFKTDGGLHGDPPLDPMALLACPFCGHAAEVYRENTLPPYGLFGIRCANPGEGRYWCRVKPDTGLNGLLENVVKFWNKRK